MYFKDLEDFGLITVFGESIINLGDISKPFTMFTLLYTTFHDFDCDANSTIYL